VALDDARSSSATAASNSVKASLSCAVPLVVLPIMSDEAYSAERCEALGVGRAVGLAERTSETVRTALRTVLSDSRYRERAQAFRAEMDALPGAKNTVELLTGLAPAHAPA
jgi:UDP:flavonoid glycosyltransferase YjiC (YdhE family)